MKLSESKLFAIEALNSIENLEWPEWAQFVEIDTGSKVSVFKCLIDGKTAHMHGINISPDCGVAGYLVSVTKEEFESVGGWVRHNNGEIPVDEDSVVQVKLHFDAISQCFPASEFNWKDGDIELWRYKRTLNKTEKLSEGKLFTIESLSKVNGFKWPSGFNFAWMQYQADADVVGARVHFAEVEPKKTIGGFRAVNDSYILVRVENNSPFINDSLVTLDEFNSVIDSVRSFTPIKIDDSEIHTHNIESLINQHKTARLSTLEARRQLELAEAAEHNLLLSIEEWAESQGFDIRLLDESEENPELVIADWRDLQRGDVIAVGLEGLNGIVVSVDHVRVEVELMNVFKRVRISYASDVCWKFISRPAK